MSTATKSLQADPVADRLASLRSVAESNPVQARDEVWQWFAEAGERLRGDRSAALAELQALFASGTPSVGIEGQTDGRLVGWTAAPIPDRLLGLVTDRWLPWAGKRFAAAENRGDNVLVGSAKWPAKALWPFYTARPHGSELTAFDFTTYVERGVLDPDSDVLVIDYASVQSNPALLIKQIRDELVQIVPGAHLGKMIFEGPGDRHTLLAYFALKSAI